MAGKAPFCPTALAAMLASYSFVDKNILDGGTHSELDVNIKFNVKTANIDTKLRSIKNKVSI